MSQHLDITQTQRLQQRLTRLQVRYVRMLEMPGPEFEQEVHNALEEMPALEAKDTAEAPRSDAENSYTEDGGTFAESAHDMQLADYGSDDDVPDYLRSHIYASRQDSPDGYIEPIVADAGDSLLDSLLSQLAQMDVTDDQMLIARYIIGNLDDNGYLTRDIASVTDDIAFSEGHIFTRDQVKEVWQMVRSLDPAGIGAADLRDCLLLQLARLPRTQPVEDAITVVRDAFDLFAKKHFDRIASTVGITLDRLRDAMAIISRLNPRPAAAIGGGPAATSPVVVPDFEVDVDNDDNITLRLLNRIPELTIEQSFARENPSGEKSSGKSDGKSTGKSDGKSTGKSEGKAAGTPDRTSARSRLSAVEKFRRHHRQEAEEFIRLVSMRQQTLFTVMSAIVKLQRQFFLTDDESQIRPMVLRDLADATGLDISVISRATQDKYVATRSGTYPLRSFFNERRHKSPVQEGATAAESEDSTPSILAAIRSIIDGEDKSSPLSDEQITQLLNARANTSIARRTVAKYREKLGYPVARLRRALT